MPLETRKGKASGNKGVVDIADGNGMSENSKSCRMVGLRLDSGSLSKISF